MLQSKVKRLVEKTTRPASVCRPEPLLLSSFAISHWGTTTFSDLDSPRRHLNWPCCLDNDSDSSLPLRRGQTFIISGAHSLLTPRHFFYLDSCQGQGVDSSQIKSFSSLNQLALPRFQISSEFIAFSQLCTCLSTKHILHSVQLLNAT